MRTERPLEPVYDRAKSFYGKAKVIVETDEDGVLIRTLRSYTTNVARISGDKVEVFGTYSATTLRHIKEILKQYGFDAVSKKQIEADYL